MYKTTFLTLTSILLINSACAQVIFSENFNNLAIGNLATDVNGNSAGQGGWKTLIGSLYISSSAANIQIKSEAVKGHALNITSGVPGSEGGIWAFYDAVAWQNRTTGNNVVKLEIEFYTGIYPNSTNSDEAMNSSISLRRELFNGKGAAGFHYNHSSGELLASTTQHMKLGKNGNSLILSKNKWYKLLLYIDYDQKLVYFEIPSLNIIRKDNYSNFLVPPEVVEDFPPKVLVLTIGNSKQITQVATVKYDNVKISAIQEVPPYLTLAIDKIAPEKFQLYPNPATEKVTISNNANILVQKIKVYDLTGKLIKTQSFTNDSEIQLNVENLTTGTYQLHIQTNEGTAVKNLIKK